MAKAKDDLEREAEERSVDRIALDPAKLCEDREILGQLNSLEVSNANPNYVYCWVRKTATSDVQVQQKLSLSIRTAVGTMPCWEVVHGTMPEAMERKNALGERQIGDTILLRCRKDVYIRLMDYQEEKNRRVQTGVSSEMEALAHESKGGIILHSDPDDPLVKRLFSNQQAMDRVTRNIREGTVPGAEMRR